MMAGSGAEGEPNIEAQNGQVLEEADGTAAGGSSTGTMIEPSPRTPEPVLRFEEVVGTQVEGNNTAFAVSDKLISVGTQDGAVCLFDYSGDLIRKFKMHKGRVTTLSFDSRTEYLASGSIDGCAVVYSLYSEENNQSMKYDIGVPITAIAIDPKYSIRKTKEICVGDDKGCIHLVSKGWLGPSTTMIFKGKHTIKDLQWNSAIIAWSSISGIRMYDANSHVPLGTIPATAQIGDGKIVLHWSTTNELLLGWGGQILQATIPSDTRTHLSAASNLSKQEKEEKAGKNITVKAVVHLPKDASLLAFSSCKGLIATFLRTSSELLLILYKNGTEVSLLRDVLPVQYRQGRLDIIFPMREIIHEISSEADQPECDEDASFAVGSILSEIDIIAFLVTDSSLHAIKPVDIKHRLSWLTEQKRYDEAINLGCSDRRIPREQVLQIGNEYMQHLFNHEQYEVGALKSSLLLQDDVPSWERWVTSYARASKLHLLAKHLPYQRHHLDHTMYNLALGACLQGEHYEILLTLLQKWPRSMFDLVKVKDKIIQQQQMGISSPVQLTALGVAFSKLEMHQNAIDVMVQGCDKAVFDYIISHNEQSYCAKYAAQLMDIDEVKATKLLVDYHEDASPEDVMESICRIEEVKRLHKSPKKNFAASEIEPYSELPHPWGVRLYNYLDWLHAKNPSAAQMFDTLLVELCSTYEPEKLMDILHSSTSYNLERALLVCTSKDLVPEQVYILGRMGSTSEALHLIMHKLRDITAAIRFASDQMEDSLWDEVVELAKGDGDMTAELLKFAGQGLDPCSIIQTISDDMRIPNFRELVLNASKRSRDVISLHKNCLATTQTDCSYLFKILCEALRQRLLLVDWSLHDADPSNNAAQEDVKIWMFGKFD